MPRFRYRAVSTTGAIVTGEEEGAESGRVIDALKARGYLPIEAILVTPSRWRRPTVLNHPDKPVPIALLAQFSQQLANLLRAGLPLDRAISTLAQMTKRSPLRRNLDGILTSVRDGQTLAEALDRQTTFPNYFCRMIEAGETAGALETVLERLAKYLQRAAKARATILSALLYPAILMLMAAGSIVMILTVVLPQFRPLFDQAGSNLPLTTRLILSVGDAITGYWWLGVVLLAGLIAVAQTSVRRPAVRLRLDKAALKSSLLAPLIQRSQCARFANILSTLLASGLPVPDALQVAQSTVANSWMRAELIKVAEAVREGEGLGQSLAEARIFPDLAVQFVRIGEETGRLEEMLAQTAELFEQQFEQTIARLMSLLVPVLTIVTGGIVAIVIGSMFTALLSVYDLAN